MNKSLIALAVLAASGVASAQSTVTLYGIADVWFGSLESPSTTGLKQTMIGSGGVDESRFGLKGSEDLGGGLKANFVLEQGFQIDTGAQSVSGTAEVKAAAAVPAGPGVVAKPAVLAAPATPGQMFSRQAYVGFSGGFGQVRLGKTYTPFDDVSVTTNPGFNSALSPNNHVWLSTAYNGTSGYNANPANTVYYATPSLSGFSGAVSYSLGENKTTAVSAGKVVSANVKYEGGPLYAGLAYQIEKADGAATTAKFTRLNASYDFGVAKLLAGYGHVTDLVQVGLAAGNKTTEYQVGADFPVSPALTLSGGYAHSKSTNLGVGNADITRSGYGLAAAYSLSKRTFLYGGVQSSKQTQATVADVKGNLYGVGIHHAF
ncbi:MAG: porin [Polaromonas sp.]|uniref:porin n=1 Tax=Polaromonas sp. TaxID=1869339 RepID=UPI001848FA37|nr:porin [Polaromonas sp.]NMM11760.1 porin [Polaromonas sp.]